MAQIMEIKVNKLFQNIKTQWISMLSPLKCMFEEYQPLLMKMVVDSTTMALATSNLDKFCDVQMMFDLTCLLLI
jgi:hypothetical protein